MSDEPTYHNAINLPPMTRRSLMLGALGLGGVATLGSRLYYLQFLGSEQFRNLAEGNRIKLIITPPARGVIFDRLGKILVENRKNFRLFLDINKNPDAASTLHSLQQWLTLSDTQFEKLLAKVTRRRFGPAILIAQNLTWEQVVAIEHHAPQLPGAMIEAGLKRFYTLSEEAAHLLGYVATISPDEKAKTDFYKWPEPQIGKQGIEKSWEKRLRGKPGLKQMEVNVKGLSIRKLEEEASTAGEDIYTSLHSELQQYTYQQLLAKESGAAVVLDVRTGEVLALASAPSLDSNMMAAGINTNNWNALRENDRLPLINKAMFGQYPPGSTFKMVTGLAAMHHGTMKPWRTVYCPGHFFLGKHRFNCWKAGGHGAMNLEHAIAESCDTYFYTLGHEMGIDPIVQMGRMLGLGAKTGIDFHAEKTGLMPDADWKMRSYNQPWQKGDTVNASIGQGFVLATPLQLALMTARMSNGGRAVTPRLTRVGGGAEYPEPALLEIDPAHLQAVIKGMEAVSNKPFGTAYWRRIMQPELAMGGKTGTAQVRRIKIRGQDQSKIPWKYRHHGLFVGYAPIHDPRYAVAVIIEHGGGSAAAAPIARDLLLKTQKLMA